MIQYRSLVLALVWQLVSVEGSFGSSRHQEDWNNWIILPARSRTSDISALKSFSGFRVNESDVNTYLDPVRVVEPYIMRIESMNEEKRKSHTRVEEDNDDNSGDDLILPLGRALEKVKNFCAVVKEIFEEDYNFDSEGRGPSISSTTRKIKKIKKKYKKLLLPLLIAYKLKFLTLIPVLIGGLVLLVGTTGLAGFFFALFAAVMSLKTDSKLEIKKW